MTGSESSPPSGSRGADSGNRKDPRARLLNVTVRYKSATVDDFIENHSHDLSRGGLFVKSRSPLPAGTLLKFELRIADDRALMQGVGRVVWRRDADAASPARPAGMGIKFIKLSPGGAELVEQLVAGRPQSGSRFEDETPHPHLPSDSKESLAALENASGVVHEVSVSIPPKARGRTDPERRKVVVKDADAVIPRKVRPHRPAMPAPSHASTAQSNRSTQPPRVATADRRRRLGAVPPLLVLLGVGIAAYWTQKERVRPSASLLIAPPATVASEPPTLELAQTTSEAALAAEPSTAADTGAPDGGIRARVELVSSSGSGTAAEHSQAPAPAAAPTAVTGPARANLPDMLAIASPPPPPSTLAPTALPATPKATTAPLPARPPDVAGARASEGPSVPAAPTPVRSPPPPVTEKTSDPPPRPKPVSASAPPPPPVPEAPVRSTGSGLPPPPADNPY